MKINLPTSEWISLGEHALFVGVAAGLTYLTQTVTGTTFGTYTPLIVAGLSLLAGFCKKLATNQGGDTPTPPAAN